MSIILIMKAPLLLGDLATGALVRAVAVGLRASSPLVPWLVKHLPAETRRFEVEHVHVGDGVDPEVVTNQVPLSGVEPGIFQCPNHGITPVRTIGSIHCTPRAVCNVVQVHLDIVGTRATPKEQRVQSLDVLCGMRRQATGPGTLCRHKLNLECRDIPKPQLRSVALSVTIKTPVDPNDMPYGVVGHAMTIHLQDIAAYERPCHLFQVKNPCIRQDSSTSPATQKQHLRFRELHRGVFVAFRWPGALNFRREQLLPDVVEQRIPPEMPCCSKADVPATEEIHVSAVQNGCRAAIAYCNGAVGKPLPALGAIATDPESPVGAHNTSPVILVAPGVSTEGVDVFLTTHIVEATTGRVSTPGFRCTEQGIRAALDLTQHGTGRI